MLNRIGCGVSALLNDFELKIKSVPCWWSIDRIEWFVWSNHLMIHLIIIASFDRIIWSHYLIASFDRTGWGGQGGSKMHVETISFQSQTHHSTSMVIVVIHSLEHNPVDCHHCCLQRDGLRLPGVASLFNAAQLSSMLGWGRISELGAIAGKQVLQWICTSCVSSVICESHSAQVWGIPAFWSHQFRGHFIHRHGNYPEGEYWDLLSGVWGFCVQSMIRSNDAINDSIKWWCNQWFDQWFD